MRGSDSGLTVRAAIPDRAAAAASVGAQRRALCLAGIRQQIQ
jgi:hypothetical protein